MLGSMRRAVLSLGLVCGACRFDFTDRIATDAAPHDALGTCDPTAPFGAPVPITELNDPASDDGTLRLAPDELSGYFWSYRLAGDAEIFLATRPDLASPFTVAHVVALGTTAAELDPTVTSDGTLIVFRRSGPGDHLYQASRSGPLAFGAATTVANVDQGTEAQPYLQPDGNEMYFQSRRTGAGDLYRTVRTGASFAPPSRVAELATASEEGDPVITPDGLTIYFRSDRPGSHALFNIWTATRATTADPFGTATEVPNVSSDGNEGPSDLSRDGCRLYISSDRAGTNDIYVATRSR